MSLSAADRAKLSRKIEEVMRVPGLTIAEDVAWWERLVERTGRERWQYIGRDGHVRRYWRRDGKVPREYSTRRAA